MSSHRTSILPNLLRCSGSLRSPMRCSSLARYAAA